MSFICIDFYQQGEPTGISREALSGLLQSFATFQSDIVWRVDGDGGQSDGGQRYDLHLSYHDDALTQVSSIMAPRGCPSEHYWEAIYGILQLGTAVAYDAECGPLVVADPAVADHLPSSLIDSHGAPLSVASADETEALISRLEDREFLIETSSILGPGLIGAAITLAFSIWLVMAIMNPPGGEESSGYAIAVIVLYGFILAGLCGGVWIIRRSLLLWRSVRQFGDNRTNSSGVVQHRFIQQEPDGEDGVSDCYYVIAQFKPMSADSDGKHRAIKFEVVEDVYKKCATGDALSISHAAQNPAVAYLEWELGDG